MTPLTIAVPTGRLRNGAARLLAAVGVVMEPGDDDRRLLVDVAGGIRLLAAKPTDLLTYVERGAADIGVSGRDMILEQRRDVYELLDLRFGACRAVVAFPEEHAGTAHHRGRLLRIATKYPRITAQYFEAQHQPVDVIVLYGSVEVAPLVGLADGIVDLVMTGRTLRENRLREVAEIAQSTARLVVNRSSLSRSPRVTEFVSTIERALLADGRGIHA